MSDIIHTHRIRTPDTDCGFLAEVCTIGVLLLVLTSSGFLDGFHEVWAFQHITKQVLQDADGAVGVLAPAENHFVSGVIVRIRSNPGDVVFA